MNEKQIRWRTLWSRVAQKHAIVESNGCLFVLIPPIPYRTDTHDSHIVKHGRKEEEEVPFVIC